MKVKNNFLCTRTNVARVYLSIKKDQVGSSVWNGFRTYVNSNIKSTNLKALKVVLFFNYKKKFWIKVLNAGF